MGFIFACCFIMCYNTLRCKLHLPLSYTGLHFVQRKYCHFLLMWIASAILFWCHDNSVHNIRTSSVLIWIEVFSAVSFVCPHPSVPGFLFSNQMEHKTYAHVFFMSSVAIVTCCPAGEQHSASDWSLRAARGAPEQSVLWFGVWSRLYGQQHLLHHTHGSAVPVQQQPTAGFLGWSQGKSRNVPSFHCCDPFKTL